jgi:hypothetical protein
MFGPDEFKARLFGVDELIGCTDEEFREIELSAGFPLPKAYKDFMLIGGKKAGNFLRGWQSHYPKVVRSSQSTKQFTSRFMNLPEPCFFFANYNGDVALFFSNEGDDPPVYKPVSENGIDTYKQCACSFWNCIEELLKMYPIGCL